MRTPLKVAAFAGGLVLTFGASMALGQQTGPVGPTHTSAMSHGGVHDVAAPIQAVGLAVAQDGYSLHVANTVVPAGVPAPLSFTITGPSGAPVTTYVPTHDKELHLILVRRDLTGFQHVHPTRAADGTWSISVTISEAGPYKLYADFAPDTRTTALVLATDLTVPGNYTPTPVAPESPIATADGDTVTTTGSLTAGQESLLDFSVTRNGSPVTLEPYLGAFGHLVAIRAGDLAYLHVHPEGETGLRFVVDVPTSGTYRLFLGYQHDGAVHTAAFTSTAGGHG